MSLKDFSKGSKLGEGAYSIVHKVERLADKETYALKQVKLGNLSEKQIQNALNEVRILASVKSKYIIGYKQAFLEGKKLCIVMEFADDGDLYQKIVEHKSKKQLFEEKEIWSVLIQSIIGLKNLHHLNILHRDLKSANIFLTKKGEAKLGDMNVSKIAKNGMLYTQTGTPYYASPQVWRDEPYDSKSDIWSLGCVLYEMTTLEPPFQAEDMEGLFKAVTLGVYPPISSKYSKQLSQIIKLMLNQKSKARPTAQKIFKSALIQNKITDLCLDSEKNTEAKEQLLKTIRIPKKLHYLTDRLPKPNYGNKNESHAVTNIKNTASLTYEKYPKNNKSHLPRLNQILNSSPSYQKIRNERNKKKRANEGSLIIEGRSKAIEGLKSIERNRNYDKQISEQLKRIYKVRAPRYHYEDPRPRRDKSIALPPIRL